jgi:hypothetical protein
MYVYRTKVSKTTVVVINVHVLVFHDNHSFIIYILKKKKKKIECKILFEHYIFIFREHHICMSILIYIDEFYHAFCIISIKSDRKNILLQNLCLLQTRLWSNWNILLQNLCLLQTRLWSNCNKKMSTQRVLQSNYCETLFFFFFFFKELVS